MRALFFNGVLERVQAKLLEKRLISTDVSAASLDSTCIKVNSAALSALKKETLGDRQNSWRIEYKTSRNRR